MRFITLALLIGLTATASNATTYQPAKLKINSDKNTQINKFSEKSSVKKDKKEVNPRIYKEAKDLESVLISVMVDPMFPKGKESGLYGGGAGSDIYRSMMIQQYGKILSNDTNLGLAENITKNLSKNKTN
jgi:Rod binding domain-containing protein